MSVPWFQETRVMLFLEGSERTVLTANRFIEEAVEINEGPARNRHDSGSKSSRVEWLWWSRIVVSHGEDISAGRGGEVFISIADLSAHDGTHGEESQGQSGTFE